MAVNIGGIAVVALGGFSVFLGVTGRYQAFVGAQSSTTAASSSANSTATQQNQAAALGAYQAFGNPPVGVLQAGSQGFVAGISGGSL